MKCHFILPSAVWCQHTSAGHSATPILSRVPPSCCASPLHTHWVQQGCMSLLARHAVVEPPLPTVHRAAGSMRGRQRFCTPQVYKVVTILALLWLGILGSHALFIQLLWSNKSKRCVFIGFVVCLSLITFLCVLAGLEWLAVATSSPAAWAVLLVLGCVCWFMEVVFKK